MKNDFVEFLVSETKHYKNGLLLNKILPSLEGRIIDAISVKELISPFIVEIEPMLERSLKRKFEVSLIDFAPISIERMFVNSHMHHGDQTSILTKNNVDALLITYLHFTFNLPNLHSDHLTIN